MVDLSAQIHPAKNLPIVTYRNPSTKVLGDDSTHTFQMFAAAPRRNIDPLNAIPPETVLSHDTVCAEVAKNVVVEDRYPDSVPRLDADRCHSLTDASMSGALSKI